MTTEVYVNRSPFFWPLSLALVCAAVASGVASCSSKSSGGGFDDDASAGGSSGSSGSSSGGGEDAASGSSSGSSSSGTSSGASSGTTPAKDSGTSSGTSGGYVAPVCGTTTCDLRTKTCCLPNDDGGPGAAYCLSGNSVSCGANIATFHCGGVDDCPSGDVCCGDYDLKALTAETVCQKPSCALAQFCRTSAECPSGVQCLAQSCALGANVHLCGLKSGPPYNCVAQ
jgi:hypothetical protein